MTNANANISGADVDIDALTSWLVENISKILGVDPSEVDIHDQLVDYGMDSRQFLDLRFDLEELLGRELPSAVMWDNPSIATLVEALTQPGPVKSDALQAGERAER